MTLAEQVPGFARVDTTPAGVPLNRWTLRIRFDAARKAAAEAAERDGTPEGVALAARIRSGAAMNRQLSQVPTIRPVTSHTASKPAR